MYLKNPEFIDENLKPYFVPDGKRGPYANLMVDLVFKKAFNPEDEAGNFNLKNLLNDLLAPQLESPIETVQLRNPEVNRSGSHATRSTSFDLHCKDIQGRLFEIEVQISPMENYLKRIIFYASQIIANQGEPGKNWHYELEPVYMLSFSATNIFNDSRPIHRITLMDLETHEHFSNVLNMTFVELRKIAATLEATAPEYKKWMFIMRYLDRLQKLPPVFAENKFEHLLNTAKVSKLSTEDYLNYEVQMHLEWDEYATKAGFFNLYSKDIQKLKAEAESVGENRGLAKGAFSKARDMAKTMRADGMPISKIMAYSGLSEKEIKNL